MQNIYIFTKKELAEFAEALYLKGKSDAEYEVALSIAEATERSNRERIRNFFSE